MMKAKQLETSFYFSFMNLDLGFSEVAYQQEMHRSMLCIMPAKALIEHWPFAMGAANKWQNENDFQDEGIESNVYKPKF